MISKISKIKNIGVYENYRWNQNLDDFKKFNLIYGWNYAGKTTLSRVFRCIQLNSLHRVSTASEYEVINNEGNKCTHEFIRSENIKVFNSDYIEENVKWEIGTVAPILILGEDSIQLEEEKRSQENSIDSFQLQKQNKINEQQDIISNDKLLRTNSAREIGTLLGIRPFDARHLGKYINLTKNREDYEDLLLTSSSFDAIKNQANSNEKKANIAEIAFETIATDFLSIANTILNKKIQDQLTISDLIEDQTLANWVRSGLSLHEGQEQCKFCGNTMPLDLLSQLKKHFSKEYEIYTRELDDVKGKFERYKSYLEGLRLPDEELIYPQLRESYCENKNLIIDAIKKQLFEIEKILETVNSRIDNIFDSNNVFDLQVDEIIDFSSINSLISEHNAISAGFDERKSNAKEKIVNHLVSKLVLDSNLHQRQTNLAVINNELVELGNKISVCKSEISRIEGIISSSTRGVERINNFLALYFGREDIKIHLKDENNYELKRQNYTVENLSEGEKTAIAFAYFMASLTEGGNNLSDTIVYIDDPISSLDSNHLFNTYAFIKDTFYKFDRTANPKHICKCKQLFISTHNFEFFNLLKDWLSNIKNEFVSHYLVEKANNVSNLKVLPNILFKHKSEYSYLFSVLYKFNENPTQDFSHLHSLPNIIRRFLESFMTFKYLTSINIEENLEMVITDSIQAERVRKFAHYYSHNLTTARLLTLSNAGECSEIVNIVLQSVKEIDEIHFEALVQNIE